MKWIYITLFLSVGLIHAQDIHFSQFYESPLLLNPAAAGASNSDFRFVVNYKNQWKSVINPFKTIALAFDSRIYLNKKKKGNHIGYGFSMYNDKAGMSKVTTNQVNLDLAYHVYFSRSSSLSAGVKAGFFQRNINTTDLKWDAQYDGKAYDPSKPTRESAIFQSFMKFDLAAGILYKYYSRANGGRFELGGSLAHITKPKISFYSSDPSLNFKYIGHMHAQVKMGENTLFLPSAMYALQGKHQEVIFGGSIKFLIGQSTREKVILNTFTLISSAIQFGAYLRAKDALIFTAAMDYKKNMVFGVSYDVNTSKLSQASKRRGGLELSFILKGLSNAKTKGNRNDR
ncbi:MAG: PorP/SprF family type IX secretion system membrane protein [Sphingobacteriaceae bacterium]|nr:PorP/SprF family type IX secretion system membrane protein [Sphingobacteriaceae bacterium]